MEKRNYWLKREYYSGLLDKNMNSFKEGKGKNIALLGSRKSGKTSIVKEHVKNAKDVVAVYIDAEKISLNPENFSIELIGNILFNFLNKGLADYKDFLTLERLLKLEREIKKNSFSLIKSIENELLKIKPDQKLLVENAFRFAETLSNESQKKFLIVLDNVENLLDLNNFLQIKDIFSLIDFKSQAACYIATSSAVRGSLSFLKDFECFEIKNFDRNEVDGIAQEILGKKDKKVVDEVYSLTNGQQYPTILLLQKLRKVDDAKKAFVSELLEKESQLYHYCEGSFNYYYNRTRGQTLLKTILKVISREELRLSEIAKKIYKSAPVTKSILERLMEVDVIYKKDNKFYFTDNVLRLWVKLRSYGYEFDAEPDEKMINEALGEL